MGTIRTQAVNAAVALGIGLLCMGHTAAGPFVVNGMEVAAGERHSCAIVAGGYVKCWGDNDYGQLGDGTTVASSVALDVPGLAGATALSAGEAHTCALVATPVPTVKCWGRNQLGLTQSTATPTAVSSLDNPVRIASGRDFNCALQADGVVKCWGVNGAGQLGNGNTTSIGTPTTTVQNLPAGGAVDVVAGSNFACARNADSSVHCWGSGGIGQLGHGVFGNSSVAVRALPGGAVALAAGTDHACAIVTSGQALCWGGNTRGQLGDNSTTQRNTPTLVQFGALSAAARIAAGNQFTCASDVGTWCWGDNRKGQFGDGTSGSNDYRIAPVQVGGSGADTTYQRIAAGGQHVCGIDGFGGVRCWGDNVDGEVGDAYQYPQRTPVDTQLDAPATAASANWASTCVVLADGRLQCAGAGQVGQLGDGATLGRGGARSHFFDVVGLSNVNAVGVGAFHACALHDGVSLSCWGDASGTGLAQSRSTPSLIATGIASIAVGFQHNCVISATGGVSCWGNNDNGQVGDGTGFALRQVPPRATGIVDGIAVAAGNKHSCAIVSGGAVRCWGRGAEGQLGTGGTPQSVNTPQPVTGLAGASAIAAGASHTCAISSGDVRCWGSNGNGQVGNGGPAAAVPSPSSVVASGAAAITAGELHTCALMGSGGAVKCWGSNGYGQLGIGAATEARTPQDVPGIAGATALAAGRYHTCAAVGSDLYCWGSNTDGQLGNGSASYQTRPIRVIDGSFAAALLLSGCASPITAGTACSVTLSARTISDTPAVTYSGTVTATSSDTLASLPGTYAFVPNDAGTHAFGITFNRSGTHSITFTDAADNLSATLSGIVVTAGPAAAIAAVGGTPQSAIARANFSAPLAARVTDASGNPIAGAIATFTLPASGASATFAGGSTTAVANTGTDGIATSPALTANGIMGAYDATASTAGVASATTFALTNIAPPPASIAVYSGSPQSATVGSAFASPLRAIVRDIDGNIVAGATVQFALPASGASATFAGGGLTASAISDSRGIADSPAVTANTVVGAFVASAAVAGVATPASFSLANLALGAASITVVSGDSQIATVGTTFGQALVARVLDSGGAPVPSATVTFSAASSGASATLSPATVVTGPDGRAQVSAIANQVAGSYQVTASTVGAATSATFALTNVAGGFTFGVATGGSFTCALTEVGGVNCWGSGGVLRQLPSLPARVPTAIAGLGAAMVSLVAGGDHACAISISGSVKCWGNNSMGQLGNGPLAEWSLPVDVTGLSGSVVMLSAGALHNCALVQSGAVQCWGSNGGGQLGEGSPLGAHSESAVAVTGLPTAIGVAAGANHSCAVTATHEVKCWGINHRGQLGDGTTTNSAIPVAVTGISASSVAAGADFTCAVTLDGKVNCWGFNVRGQLGNGSFTQSSVPTEVVGLDSIVAVTLGYDHACALTGAGAVKCWGGSSGNLLGNGGSGSGSPLPVNVSLSREAVQIYSQHTHTCARMRDGTVSCWGLNSDAQLGDGTLAVWRPLPTSSIFFGGPAPTINPAAGTPQTTPAQVAFAQPLTVNIRDGSGNPGAGYVVSFAVPVSGPSASLSSRWAVADSSGATQVGAVANGVTGSYVVSATAAGIDRPAQFALTNQSTSLPDVDVLSLAAGGRHNCVIEADFGGVLCWGDNGFGQLGDGTTTGRAQPMPVAALGGRALAVRAHLWTSCALLETGAVKCWGHNASGRLGDGTTTDRSTPVQVTGLTSGIVGLSVGGGHACALTQAGGVKCWGWNGNGGQLGDGTTTDRSTPVDVVGLASGVIAISAGDSHTCALMADRTVKCWGLGSYGQLGTGTSASSATPVDVAGLSDVASIHAAGLHTCAVRNDGTVNCWGDNSSGALGDGSFASRSIAAPVPSLANVASLSASEFHSCALAAGAISCWGGNDYGQLGDGSTAASPVPLAVASLGSITGPGAGYTHTCALRESGGVRCLGDNTYGQLGDPSAPSGGSVPAIVARLDSHPISISATAGSAQSTQSGMPFVQPLAATVLDDVGLPMAGIGVTFVLAGAAASANFATGARVALATTDANGVATSPALTASNAAGAHTAKATIDGRSAIATFALTNTAATPASISAVQGSLQTASVGTMFALSLKAQVKDGSGLPLAGMTVTFTLPASGASGTFAGGGTTVTASTDSTGVATSPGVLANMALGNWTANATVVGVASPATFSLTNAAGAPVAVVASGGTPQNTIAGTLFGATLQAKVTDASGNPVSGVTVTFNLPPSGATANFTGGLGKTAAAITDASGTAASPTLTATSTNGSFTATAMVSGIAAPANYSLTTVPRTGTTMSVVSGSPQSTVAGTAFAQPLVAVVRDASNNPVPGLTLTFTIPGTTVSGTFAGGGKTATLVTDASGMATSPPITATTRVGTFVPYASVAGLTRANFSLSITPAAPATVTARVGAQMTPVYTQFAKALAVRVTDAFANVVPNVPVMFTLPVSGPGATFAEGGTAVTVATDSTGVATSSLLTASNVVGAYLAEATTAGVATPATFKLTNTAGAGATITATTAAQSTVVGKTFSQPLAAFAGDASGRPIAGVPVKFTLPNSTLSASFADGTRTFAVTTGADGRVTTTALTATTRSGKYAPSLSATGISGVKYFDLTNLPDVPATATATVGAQSAPVGAAFAKPLGVLVKDAYGNVVPGVPVRIDLPSIDPSATFAGGSRSWTGVTDATGKATSPVVTADMFVGSFVATSQVEALAAPTFSLRTTITAGATIAATGGTPQTTGVNAAYPSPLQAAVRDASGQPLGGVVVTFTVTTSRGTFPGGAGSANVSTDARGIAVSPVITATGVKGTWTATARGAGITTGNAAYALTTQ